MTGWNADRALAVTTRAVALVLDLDEVGLRADSPLADLGVDDLARVSIADVVEAVARERDGVPVHVDPVVLRTAVTIGQLAAGAEVRR